MARAAVFVVFGLNGFLAAMWVVHIPAITERTHVSNSTLGMLILLMAGSGIAGMQAAGPLADRFGSRVLVAAAACWLAVAVLGPGLATGPWSLAVALAAFGFGNGALDVSMNTQAVQVEREYPRPIMSAFHALFSCGGLAGSLIGAAALHRAWDLRATLALAATLSLALTAACTPRLLPRPQPARPTNTPTNTRPTNTPPTNTPVDVPPASTPTDAPSANTPPDVPPTSPQTDARPTSTPTHARPTNTPPTTTPIASARTEAGPANTPDGNALPADTPTRNAPTDAPLASGPTGCVSADGPSAGTLDHSSGASAPARSASGGGAAASRKRASRKVFALAAIAFALLMTEGVANDWSALQLREHLGADEATAALAFGAFSTTMTVGRFGADRVSGRYGPVAVVRWGALLAAGGLVSIIASVWVPLTLCGWALLGIGLAGGVPQIFSAAGNLGTATAATDMSRVFGLGYLGFLAGPSVIGWLSEPTSLTTALVFPLVLVVLCAYFAPIVDPEDKNS